MEKCHRNVWTAFEASCMNEAWVFEWHKRFKEGRVSVRDDGRCRKSKEVRTPELIGQIKNFMDKDRRVSIEAISAQFDVSVGNVYTIIREELKMQKIWGKFVPRVLRGDQKERQQGDGRADQFLSRSSWCSGDLRWNLDLLLWTRDQETVWKHAGSPRPKKARQTGKSTHKLLMIPFLTALAWSTCTGFPLDRQSTRNTMLRF